MPRSAASIQAEITALENFLQSADSLLQSVGSDGTSRTVQRKEAAERLDELYQHLGRVDGSAPMVVRGRLDGLGGVG